MPPERTFLWRRSFRAGSSEAQLLSTKKKRQRYLHSDRGAGRQLHPLTVGGRGQATEERGRRSRTSRCQSNTLAGTYLGCVEGRSQRERSFYTAVCCEWRWICRFKSSTRSHSRSIRERSPGGSGETKCELDDGLVPTAPEECEDAPEDRERQSRCGPHRASDSARVPASKGA